VARLVKNCKNIIAIKEASGNLDVTSEILSLCDIIVVSGDDSLTLPLMSIGGTGIISVVANIVPRDVKKMVDAFARGRIAEAQKRHLKLFPLCRAMFYETNPIPVKTAMRLLGRLNGEMRLPLSAMTAEKEKMLIAALKDYGLL
jgi:4-hydroxy-tetrahydrodipicolinate synthase